MDSWHKFFFGVSVGPENSADLQPGDKQDSPSPVPERESTTPSTATADEAAAIGSESVKHSVGKEGKEEHADPPAWWVAPGVIGTPPSLRLLLQFDQASSTRISFRHLSPSPYFSIFIHFLFGKNLCGGTCCGPSNTTRLLREN